jgi:phenylalanyl-tRNA synthetase beta chain
MGPTVLGRFGALHPRTLELLDIEGPVVAFELVLDRIPVPKARPTKARPRLDLPDLQPVRRDFAFVVDRGVRAADITRAVQSAERKLITGINVFDLYEGPGIAEGKKSVAVEVTLQPRERTLTDPEIEAVAAAIVAQVGKATGAALRS